MVSRGNNLQSSEKLCKYTSTFILSSVSYELQHCLRHLVLLEMIYFEIFKTVRRTFAIQCKQSRYKVFVHFLIELLVDPLLTFLGHLAITLIS